LRKQNTIRILVTSLCGTYNLIDRSVPEGQAELKWTTTDGENMNWINHVPEGDQYQAFVVTDNGDDDDDDDDDDDYDDYEDDDDDYD
jgi:hypothetical protein